MESKSPWLKGDKKIVTFAARLGRRLAYTGKTKTTPSKTDGRIDSSLVQNAPTFCFNLQNMLEAKVID